MSALFSLPNELIDAIVSALSSDRPTLLALAQTCSKLQPFAEAQFFKNIYIRDGTSVTRLAQHLEQPPWRVRLVEHLEVTPSMHSWRGGIALMPELVGRLAGLKSLKVEAPMIKTKRMLSRWPEEGQIHFTRVAHSGASLNWSEEVMVPLMDLFAGNGEGALGCLTSFTLHSHGTNTRFYNIKEALPVFLSPTLKHLHLSCVDVSGATETFAALGSASPSTRTPLETLILQRCSVPSSRLDEFQPILSRPRALRSFTVLLDVDFVSLNAQRVHAPAFIAAIQQHSHSLEYLRYTHPAVHIPARGSPEHLNASLFSALSTLRQSCPGLSTFHRLHTFAVDHRSNLAEFLIDPALAPPNLRTLRLTGTGYHYELEWRHLRDFISAIASATPFSHLWLHARPCGPDIADVCGYFSRSRSRYGNNNTPPLRDVFANLIATLGNTKTVKFVYAHQPRHIAEFRPPFLHGEYTTDEAVIFDSEKLWSAEADVDARYAVEKYIPSEEEDVEVSGWSGPFTGLGNSFWKE
ncbi:hypothetical protein BDV95DRAFT_612988 [Massariosphaeria phaeospora]|uniref:F-box domain-containing protein n=1 Tax=Massariosphaeria phaeospora TaxID=100035 RepID=A0A7C8MEF5_9PLEO|nr:hypothetical protein BDV95DRAFT_612988 [Massariosphaeria phaeospora]